MPPSKSSDPWLPGTVCPLRSSVQGLPDMDPITSKMRLAPQVMDVPCRTDCTWYLSGQGCAVAVLAKPKGIT